MYNYNIYIYIYIYIYICTYIFPIFSFPIFYLCEISTILRDSSRSSYINIDNVLISNTDNYIDIYVPL